MELALLLAFFAATLRIATPLLLAATGELVAERAGVLNLGIEGAMLVGALAAALSSASTGPATGLVIAAIAGAACGGVVALVAVGAGADQVITGTAVTLGAIGLTGAVYRATLGSGASQRAVESLQTPWVVSVGAVAAIPCLWWVLYRTRAGLLLRASGEAAEAAAAN